VDSDDVDCTAVVQFNAGILLGVMGTDVPLSDFFDTIPEHKVSSVTKSSTHITHGCSGKF